LLVRVGEHAHGCSWSYGIMIAAAAQCGQACPQLSIVAAHPIPSYLGRVAHVSTVATAAALLLLTLRLCPATSQHGAVRRSGCSDHNSIRGGWPAGSSPRSDPSMPLFPSVRLPALSCPTLPRPAHLQRCSVRAMFCPTPPPYRPVPSVHTPVPCLDLPCPTRFYSTALHSTLPCPASLQRRGFRVYVLPLTRTDWFKVGRAIFTRAYWSGSSTTSPGYSW